MGRAPHPSAALPLSLLALAALILPGGAASRGDIPRARVGVFLDKLAAVAAAKGPAAAIDLAAQAGLRVKASAAGDTGWIPVIASPRTGTTVRQVDFGRIRTLGARLDATSRSYLRVYVPPQLIRRLAEHPDFEELRTPYVPKELGGVGGAVSESVGLTGAEAMQDLGFDGAGFRAGVVDLGFSGLQDAIDAGELPNVVIVDLPGSYDDDIESYTVHGTGVAEHVADMAPAATIYTYLVGDSVDLENTADHLRDNDVHVANHSVGWVTASYYDDTGSISGIINRSHDTDGVFWAVAAGNSARDHWSGDFTDVDGDGFHEWAPGDEDLALATASSQIQVFLNWDEYGNSVTDLDFFLVDKDGNTVSASAGGQNGPQAPVEIISTAYSGSLAPYSLRVQRFSGANSPNLTVFSFNNELSPYVEAGSLMDPAPAHGAFTVAAIHDNNWNDSPPAAAAYSSRGPTTDGRDKPDISAPDCTRSFTYGNSSCGTSFSSPTTAGAALLMLDWSQDNGGALVGDPAALGAALAGLADGFGGDIHTFGAGKLAVECNDPCDDDTDGDGTTDCLDGCPDDAAKIAPGQCGCGAAETDTDNDGVADCVDGCVDDPDKADPGQCGCGLADTDTDSDGSADCVDGCVNDSAKTDPGQCGCGVADLDSDSDGTADCNDGCPNDADKLVPGVCGCGTPDTDGDGDGTADCNDGCPLDPDKTAPGLCGCDIPDADTDGDGTADCNDGCPADAAKTVPGACGCGAADTDSDGDGLADCNDLCPDDGDKAAPGICGCGVSDVDSDFDTVADCDDGCPGDPDKSAPGICGCGQSDDDTDGDGGADCEDLCPLDPAKSDPGQCGCGESDVDGDSDGTADCADGCPEDGGKIDGGVCGCGTPDVDTDGDGAPDCQELCPDDGDKTVPGICGCGVGDADGDGDGTADCVDGCPEDAAKADAGVCGCGVVDTDGDGDGTADCLDGCPADGTKVDPGQCGCGAADTDGDGDGTADCNDLCPDDPDRVAPGGCGCGVPDDDSDGDGTLDCDDGCPDDPDKTVVGQCGCGVADTDGDGDGTADCNDGCPADASKVAPGICGCGVSDGDSDGDGTIDCNDGCPADPAKTGAGICGCGVSDADGDGDGTADCNDGCAGDASKVAPGICGCGVADTDGDGDGSADCDDGCPADPAKTAPGMCGCGQSDADSDNDGTADCNDDCPDDAIKTDPGQCGCDTPDTDSDGDGTPDCDDGCVDDPDKVDPGICACGVADEDSDGDGTADCDDDCEFDPAKIDPGVCGCGVDDDDSDDDGTADCIDGCPADGGKVEPGACGCGVADGDSDGDGVDDCNDPCPDDPADLCAAIGPTFEFQLLHGVGSTQWTAVATDRVYERPVVVCTPNYTEHAPPSVVRLRNVGAAGFELKIGVTRPQHYVPAATVHCLVVEEGVYTYADDGVKMEAFRYSARRTDRSPRFRGQRHRLANLYDDAVTVAQVMSHNDERWSVTHATAPRNRGRRHRARTEVSSGKHVGESRGRASRRSPETVGVVVVEAGPGFIGATEFFAGRSPVTVGGMGSAPPYDMAHGGIGAPAGAVLTMSGMRGRDGGWAVLYGADPVDGAVVKAAIDEDQVRDAERSHTTESVSFIVLGAP